MILRSLFFSYTGYRLFIPVRACARAPAAKGYIRREHPFPLFLFLLSSVFIFFSLFSRERSKYANALYPFLKICLAKFMLLFRDRRRDVSFYASFPDLYGFSQHFWKFLVILWILLKCGYRSDDYIMFINLLRCIYSIKITVKN